MCAQWRLRSAWASAQSDQSSLSAWRSIGSLATQKAHGKDSDQTGQMPRLIWVFAGRTCHFVGFVMLLPNFLQFSIKAYMSHVTRKPVYAIYEQQKRRSACAPAQSNQQLCCSLPRWYDISCFYIRNFKLASVAAQAGFCLTWSQPLKTDFLVTWLILWVLISIASSRWF